MIAVIVICAVFSSGPLIIRRLTVDVRSFLFRVQMILLIEAVMFAGSWYVWTRLRYLLDSIPKGSRGSPVHCTLFTNIVVAVILSLAQMSFVIHYFIHGDDPPVLSFICFVCLGVFVQYVVCYFCLGRAFQVIDWVGVRFFGRKKIRHYICVHWTKFFTALLFSISMSAYGLYRGLQPPTVKTVEIPIKGLPKSMDRLTVAAVSDIHLGPTVGRTKLERVVHMLNSLNCGLYHLLCFFKILNIFITITIGLDDQTSDMMLCYRIFVT